MKNDHRSTYRGCSICTRSTEIRRPTDWAELDALPSSWARRFTGSFVVDPDAENDDSWQQFPPAIFRSGELAEGHALAVAKRSIDQMLAGA
ncbi:MAG: hypothetical protein ABI671_13780 [Burkholderiales bacterium]